MYEGYVSFNNTVIVTLNPFCCIGGDSKGYFQNDLDVSPQKNCNHSQVFILSPTSQAVCHALLLFTPSPDPTVVSVSWW